jgi:hypothetical protein
MPFICDATDCKFETDSLNELKIHRSKEHRLVGIMNKISIEEFKKMYETDADKYESCIISYTVKCKTCQQTFPGHSDYEGHICKDKSSNILRDKTDMEVLQERIEKLEKTILRPDVTDTLKAYADIKERLLQIEQDLLNPPKADKIKKTYYGNVWKNKRGIIWISHPSLKKKDPEAQINLSRLLNFVEDNTFIKTIEFTVYED